MGLEVVSFNVQKFTDDQNLIENQHNKNSEEGSYRIAESEKEIESAKARAKKEANDARILAESEIAQKNNELAIKLKKAPDTQQAVADAAYEIQREEKRKTTEVSRANANIAASEKDVELKAKEAEVKEKALEAEIKKMAEAEKYKAQQEADAKLYQFKKEAEADRFQREQEAEAQKAEAEVLKYAKMPLSQVDKITMYSDGNSSKLVGDIIGSTTQITDGLSEATGVDLRALLAGFLGGKMAEASHSKASPEEDIIMPETVAAPVHDAADKIADSYIEEAENEELQPLS